MPNHVNEFYNYVDDKFQAAAIKRLNERVDAGEDPATILRIEPKYQFYVDKICKGLICLSYELYDRIMSCTEEDKL